MDPLETYIRTGDVSPGLVRNKSGTFALPGDWFGLKPITEAFSMPAATPAMLQDRNFDIKKWLVEEASAAWTPQLDAATVIGPASILRDSYSAKPYVLFYITARVVQHCSNLATTPVVAGR